MVLSYRQVFTEGPKLPWLSVLAATTPGRPWLGHPLLPTALVAGTGLLLLGFWRFAGRLDGFGSDG